MGCKIFRYCLVFVLFYTCSTLPLGKKEDHVEMSDEEKELKGQQDMEYYRYISQVFSEIQNDPELSRALENLTEADMHAGGVIDHLHLAKHDIRMRLDEIKRMEIERQRDLIRQKKLTLEKKEGNEWHPMHHENKETFEAEDLLKLAKKHSHMLETLEKSRKRDFKLYEMKKEHDKKEKMKKMSTKEKEEFLKHEKEKEEKDKQHEKLHEPGSEAQLHETWEKDDELDPESYDSKTLFNLHDKNGDGYLDLYELETTLLSEVDKVYNESDPNTDLRERQEELDRMSEHMMESIDKDADSLISMDEWLKHNEDTNYKEDNEWKPLTEEDQYTDEEYAEYEKEFEDEEQPTPPPH